MNAGRIGRLCAALTMLLAGVQHAAETQPPSPAATPATAADSPKIAFSKLDLDPVGPLKGWLAVGDDADLAWTPEDGVFLLHHTGDLEPLVVSGAAVRGLAAACFDGRYVWGVATGGKSNPPRLVMIDITGGRAWEFAAADGLPPASGLAITALEAGSACAVGTGGGRTWCALLTLDEGKKTIRIVHQFPNPAKANSRDQWRDAEVSFDPIGLCTLARQPSNTAPAHRVAVGRASSINSFLWNHPLRIELQSGTVEVIEQDVPASSNTAITSDGDAWYAWAFRRPVNIITRLSFADVKQFRFAVDGKWVFGNHLFRHARQAVSRARRCLGLA